MFLLVAAVDEELGELSGAALGIGPVVAASRLSRLLAVDKPDAVVMLGTGGAYDGGPALGTACVARRIGLADGASVMGMGYVPRPPPPVPCDPRLIERVDAPQVDVLTVGSVTTDPVLASRLSDGWQVEHLEAFGVARACADAHIPFIAVLGIAHRVGPDAHAQWLTHRLQAQAAAREAVVAVLHPTVSDPT